jgi:hypothetical protein
MKGRLNLFQSAMLRWRELHPYNAVHVVRVAGTLDRARLHDAIVKQLAFAGLAGLELDRARRRYEYCGGPPAFELEVIAAGGDGERALCDEIERQLNRPFAPDGRIDPFRFFLLSEDGAFRLGLAYDHFIAGGDSILALANDIVDRYEGTPARDAAPELYPPPFARLFTRQAGRFVRGLGWMGRTASSCRRGMRPRYQDADDGYNGFVHVALEPSELAAILAAARSWDVTFNDALLAVMLHVLAANLPEHKQARRRREIAVASIMNLRAEFGFGTREVFGQFLSSMRISHPVPDGIALAQLARDVHLETTRIKTGKLYLQTLAAVRLNSIVWWFLNERRRRRLYAKAYPVWAGVTALNVNALWRARDGASTPPDYVRAVPTGPLAPLVVAATTCGNTLHLGVSYRRSAFSREKVARIAASVAACIRSLQ